MQRISSRKNLRVKEVAKLRQRRQRERRQRLVIDGLREIRLAIDSGIEIVEAFLCDTASDEQSGRDERSAIVAELQSRGAQVSLATGDVFDKLCFGDRDEGIVAVAKPPERSLAQLKLPSQPLVAVLEGLEKPGNLGAIMRSADGAGVDAVIVADALTDLFNPNTIRASLGTVFAASVCTATSVETLAWLRERNLPMYVASPDGAQDYTQADFSESAAIVFGSEADGISDAWRQADVAAVRLPMLGQADSLNVSATAAVLFYEARRQRELRRTAGTS